MLITLFIDVALIVTGYVSLLMPSVTQPLSTGSISNCSSTSTVTDISVNRVVMVADGDE